MAKVKPLTEQTSTLKSWSDVDGFLKSIAVIESKKMKEEADMNDAILAVQEQYQPGIDKLNAEKIGYERDVQLFCDKNKNEFEESRSKTLNYGLVGFRKGAGALKTLTGFTWKSVVSLLRSSKKYLPYLREKIEIDKNALISSGMKTEQLAKIGLQIVQEDSFYYEAFIKSSSEESVS